VVNILPTIPGLRYIPEFLNSEQHDETLAAVDALPWLNDLQRRVQHYGYKYNYRERSISKQDHIGPLPLFAQTLAGWLVAEGFLTVMPDQLIVNEYLPGQGIAAHIDCVPCFYDRIETVTLGHPYELEFSRYGDTQRFTPSAGSALLFSKDARYQWKHAIVRRTHDDGIPRGRRVSLTFRNVIVKE